MSERRPVTREQLRNVVKIGGGVWSQPESGPPELLVSAEELNERKITQDYWIREQHQRLGLASRF